MKIKLIKNYQRRELKSSELINMSLNTAMAIHKEVLFSNKHQNIIKLMYNKSVENKCSKQVSSQKLQFNHIYNTN